MYIVSFGDNYEVFWLYLLGLKYDSIFCYKKWYNKIIHRKISGCFIRLTIFCVIVVFNKELEIYKNYRNYFFEVAGIFLYNIFYFYFKIFIKNIYKILCQFYIKSCRLCKVTKMFVIIIFWIIGKLRYDLIHERIKSTTQ